MKVGDFGVLLLGLFRGGNADKDCRECSADCSGRETKEGKERGTCSLGFYL